MISCHTQIIKNQGIIGTPSDRKWNLIYAVSCHHPMIRIKLHQCDSRCLTLLHQNDLTTLFFCFITCRPILFRSGLFLTLFLFLFIIIYPGCIHTKTLSIISRTVFSWLFFYIVIERPVFLLFFCIIIECPIFCLFLCILINWHIF